jgi:hypothetical protein
LDIRYLACVFFRDVLYLRTLALIGQIALVPHYVKGLGNLEDSFFCRIRRNLMHIVSRVY